MANMNIKSDDAGEDSEMDCCPCIYLNDDQVEALGLKNPVAGTVYNLKVTATATRVSTTQEEPDETKAEGNAPDVSLTLKLTDIEVVGGDTGKSIAATLYGE
jgi:hypothetical protein